MSEKNKSRPPPSEGENTEPPSPPSSSKVEVSPSTHIGNYTSKSAREISKKIVRYNSCVNSSFMFYIVFFYK